MLGSALRRRWQYAAKRIKVEFLAPGGAPSTIRTGTGFMLLDDRALVVLVTNAHMVKPDPGFHVVEIEVESWVQPTADPGDPPTSRVFARASFKPGSPRIVLSQTEDVAAVAFTVHDHGPSAAIRKGASQPEFADSCVLRHWSIAGSELATDEYLSRHLAVGSQVGVFGFPSVDGWEFERPIGNFGPVSSDPRVEAPSPDTPGRAVLYQTLSRMGMSGGPVVADEFGIRIAGRAPDDYYQPPCVVGVNAGHLTRGPSHAGLSYFYRADAIRDVVSQLPSPTIAEVRHVSSLPDEAEGRLREAAQHYGCDPEQLTLEQYNSFAANIAPHHDSP